jgi:hypothetical protein
LADYHENFPARQFKAVGDAHLSAGYHGAKGLPQGLAGRLLAGGLLNKHQRMKLMLLIKTAFVMGIFLLLVLMGVHNRGQVDFSCPPLIANVVQQPAALMYFAFFAIGVITGTVITFGGSKSKEPKKV